MRLCTCSRRCKCEQKHIKCRALIDLMPHGYFAIISVASVHMGHNNITKYQVWSKWYQLFQSFLWLTVGYAHQTKLHTFRQQVASSKFFTYLSRCEVRVNEAYLSIPAGDMSMPKFYLCTCFLGSSRGPFILQGKLLANVLRRYLRITFTQSPPLLW